MRNPKDWPYEDIVNLPHHVSQVHPPMDPIKRAAQFAPFAALTGYEDAVVEAARLTDEQIEPDENVREEMDRRITEAAARGLEIRLTVFVPDERKTGGHYASTAGKIRRIGSGMLELESGERIPLQHIVKID